jgi:hypothetical protein
MSFSISKFLKEYHIIVIVIVIIGLYFLYNYFQSKGKYGYEMMTQDRKKAYNNNMSMGSNNPQPAQESGNEVYSSVNGANQGNTMNLPPSCNKGGNQNPADLLPKDTNSQWAQLNPAGKGDLANINLLKAGYHIGIDTIGQTLRNANLQIRSEPPNPQVNVGPWNLSTIDPDFMRAPLQLGQGPQ